MWSRAVSLFNYCAPNTSNLIYWDRTILSYCHKYPFCLEWLHFERCSAHPDPSLCGKSAGWFNAYKHSARCDKVNSMPCATVKSPCLMKCLTFPTRQVTVPWLAVSSPWTALIPCKGFGMNPLSQLYVSSVCRAGSEYLRTKLWCEGVSKEKGG